MDGAPILRFYLIAAAAINMAAGAFLAVRWFLRREHRSRVFAVFCAAICVWSFVFIGWQLSSSAAAAFTWLCVLVGAAGFIGPLFLHHILRVAGRTSTPMLVLSYSLAGLTLFALYERSAIEGVGPRFGLPFWPIAGVGFMAVVASYSVFLLGVGVGVVASSSAPGYHRQGLRLHCLVACAGAAIGFSNVPSWYDNTLPPWLNLLFAPVLFGMSYTLDVLLGGIKPTVSPVRRWVFCVLLAGGIAAMLTLCVMVVLSLIGLQASANVWLLIFGYHVALAAACLTLVPRLLEFESAAWRFLYPAGSDLMQALAKLERDLPTCALPNSGTMIVKEIARSLNARSVAIYLPGDREGLHIAGLVGVDPRSVPVELSNDCTLVRECIRHSESLRLRWLDFVGTEQWVSNWDTAIPALSDGTVVLLLLINPQPRASLRTSVIRELETLALRIHNILYTHRLAGRLARQESLMRLGYLSAGIAHEVRNPLTTVRTYVELAHRGELDETGEAQLYAAVMAGMDRIVGAIDAVGAYADNRGSARAAVVLRDVVEQARAMCAGDLRKHRVSLTDDIPQDVLVWGNRRELLQVFANLVTNAIEAQISRGSGAIDITAEPLPSTGLVCVRVADSGPGLPESVRSRLGHPFVTSKEGKDGRRTGYGLGLSIVMDRILNHGGTLTYEPPAFVFTLPLTSDPSAGVRQTHTS